MLHRLHFRINPIPRAYRRSPSVRVICIADTHNATPWVPNGDVLIHAGDLTQFGTFDELQAQLNWLNSLPHQHKVVIAGNHDVLFDDAFIEKFPHRAPLAKEGKGKQDLDWRDTKYLQDTSVMLTGNGYKLKVFGSPKTQSLEHGLFNILRFEMCGPMQSLTIPTSLSFMVRLFVMVTSP